MSKNNLKIVCKLIFFRLYLFKFDSYLTTLLLLGIKIKNYGILTFYKVSNFFEKD